MAVKRYNGTSWDTVAGKGEQGTSSSITTWVKTAAGGETSLSGSSDSSTTLAYTPGQEQFFINGVLQVRGSDYTATNGTSITGITALVAGDVATVTTVNAFSVTGAVPLSTVTANGDLIVGTSSGAVGRLGVGSTGQLLTVSGGVPTWAAPPSSALSYTLLNTGGTLLSGSSTAITGISGYSNLLILVSSASSTNASARIFVTINNQNAGGDYDCAAATITAGSTYAASNFSDRSDIGADHIRLGVLSSNAASTVSGTVRIDGANGTGKKAFTSVGAASAGGGNGQESFAFQGIFNGSATISSIEVKTNSGTFDAGRVYVWGA